MAINIPSRLQDAAVELFTSSDEDRRELLQAFQSVEPVLNMQAYEKGLQDKFPVYQLRKIQSYIQFFFSLYNLNERDGSAEKIAQDFVDGISELDYDPIIEATEEDFKSFYNFTLDVLNSHENLGLTARGMQVMTQHNKTFGYVEIYTDIRNIFSKEKPEDSPRAAMITHTLKLHIHSDGDYEDIYVAMDYDDLEALEKAIERAKKKHRSSRAVIRNADLDYLPTKGEADG